MKFKRYSYFFKIAEHHFPTIRYLFITLVGTLLYIPLLYGKVLGTQN